MAELIGLETPKTKENLSTLTSEEQVVYSILETPKTKTAVTRETNFPAHIVQTALAGLEMKGLVTETLGTIKRQQ